MVSINQPPLFRQEKRVQNSDNSDKIAPPPAGTIPAWPVREKFIIGVHSLDPEAGIISRLPESLDLVDRIEEKALKLEISRMSRRSTHGHPGGALVSSSKTHPRGYLPDRCFVPTEPVWCYQVFRRDAYVCRYFPATPQPEKAPSIRKAIFEFSDKSRAHLDHVCCNSGHRVKCQVALTYHNQNPKDGETVKRHLDKWLKSYRRRFPGESYLWVLEFQRRGVPHFHVFLTVKPSREMQKKLARTWVNVTKCGQEDPDHSQYWWHARRAAWIDWKMDNGNYVMKEYAIKHAQKEVPPEFQNVGRFWGCSRDFHPKPDVFGSEEIANLTKNKAIHWDSGMVRHYFDRVFRRLQEHQMNYDRQGKRRCNPITGKVNRKRKASMTRQQSSLTGVFKIKNGGRIFERLLNYIVDHQPDEFTFKHRMEIVPF